MEYLLKTEPSAYSFDDLEREEQTIWDGVKNAGAVKYLRGMKSGDRLVIYHSGNEKAVVGTAKVLTVVVKDPKNPQVRIGAGEPLEKRRTLKEIKAEKLFADSPLVKQGRLSVVPLTDAQWAWLTGA
jgi:predicted RNA-binding protein with PUA-like domain